MRLTFALTAAALFLAASGASLAAEKPNFVWLISEDNSTHYLKLFDEHGAETPRIRELAEHGLLFEHAFSNAPVCSVARTTLITGCYAPRIGTQFHRRAKVVPLPDGLEMFPAYLREAGYYTTNNQKKDYNAVEGDGVWDESSNKATWRNRREGQPFFHMQSFTASHESSLHFSASAVGNQKTETGPDSVFVAPYHPDTELFRYTYARYHDRIQEIDRQIGAVVDQLDEDGLLEETFIFYFGDHGGVLPRGKGYAYESGLHVPLVVRVPKDFRHLAGGPEGPSAARVKGFVSFIDFGPTLLALAGLKTPAEMDGRPFLGEAVSFEELNRRDEAFGYADRFDEKYDLVRTLRKGKFKYMRSYQPFNFDGLQNNYRYRMAAYEQWRELYHAGKLNAVQRQFFEPRSAETLYDLASDPYETRNLAGDPDHAETLAVLRKGLTERVKGMPDLSFYPESVLVERAFDDPTAFGQAHRQDIAQLVDVADLSLLPFDKAQGEIDKALASADPWSRYWGLIVCSSFGDEAQPFTDAARRIAAGDEEILVRVRAAEFLGLIAAADPGAVLLKALAETESGVEAALILNTVVLLRDGKPGYELDLSKAEINPVVLKHDAVKRRLDYLLGGQD